MNTSQGFRLHSLCSFSWKFGLFLILLFGIPRFILVLGANAAGGYQMVSFIFVAMWFAPFILLNKQGRKEIGMKRPRGIGRMLLSFLAGMVSCAVIFAMYKSLYGETIQNAFAYIGKVSGDFSQLSDSDRLTYFIIAVIPSMLFSPIGEEFLYRGIIHRSFSGKFGEKNASAVDSLAFALTHLAHFGILWTVTGWAFLPVPAVLWVISMYAVSRLFFECKQWCDSLFGAVVAHAGFNLAMMYFIFYHL